MVTVTVEEIVERLPSLLENVKQGEDVLITQNDLPFARLMPVVLAEQPKKQRRQLGLLAGKIILADDYATPLDDFKDYL